MNMDFLYETNVQYDVIIWGAGYSGCDVYQTLSECFPNIHIVEIVDKERKKVAGAEYLGKIVSSTDKLLSAKYDYIILATVKNEYKEQMVRELEEIGIDKKKLLFYTPAPRIKIIEAEMKKDDYLLHRCCSLLEDITSNCCEVKEVDRELSTIEDIVKRMKVFRNEREWYVDRNFQCAYLNIPKSAGSSVIKSVCGIKEDSFIQEKAKEQCYRYKLPGSFGGYKFTFVRNPFNRILSCYKNKIEGRKESEFLEKNYLPLCGLDQDRGFEAFVDAISRIPDKWSNTHFKSQYQFVYQNGKCIVDYVGKVENLIIDYEKIREKYNLESLQKINSSGNYSIKEYYTRDLVQKVYKRYRQDVIVFGYQEEYENLMRELSS